MHHPLRRAVTLHGIRYAGLNIFSGIGYLVDEHGREICEISNRHRYQVVLKRVIAYV